MINYSGKKILYAIAYEVYYKGGNIETDIEYIHALNQKDARGIFLKSYSKKGRLEIVGIAPAIGFHVNDNHGEKLQA